MSDTSLNQDNLDQNNDSDSINSQIPKKFWKFWAFMVLFNVGFAIVLIKLFLIQVVHGKEFQVRARKQHESTIELAAPRGNIYDRNGKLLATSIRCVSVAVDPSILEDQEAICTELAKSIGVPKSKLLQKINSSNRSFVWLARGVEAFRLENMKQIKDKGLILVEEYRRVFPYGQTGTQIIGLTDIDNHGIAGIELGYDSLLIGKKGYMVRYKDARGFLRYSANLPIVDASVGHSLQLTIDIELQRIVENALIKGMERSQAEAGTAICIKPQTGEIIAMASYPLYDPENPSKTGFEGLRLRGITDTYEPGSTFKMITAAAALEEKICDENTIFDGHNGVAEYKNFTIHDVHGMGRVSFRKAMEQSSNIIMGEVASRIPDATFYKYIRNFGFGKTTDIDLPGEVKGRIQEPKNFNATSKRYMGHGYGLSCTALQLSNAYSCIANGGVLMKPYIVNKVYNPNISPESDDYQNSIDQRKPTMIRRVITQATATRLANIAVGIVDSGSGKPTKFPGIRVAGKTGTSQQITNGSYSKSNYNASFAGFYPAENPQIEILVVVDRPRTSIFGGSNAAPIFKDITAAFFATYPDITKGIKFDRATNVKIEVKPDSIITPDICGMKLSDAKKISSELGLGLASEATDGIVFNQFPKKGTKVPPRTFLNVTLMSGNQANSSKDSTSNDDNRKHNVVGLSLRRAVAILQKAGIRSKVMGDGNVYLQTWYKDKTNTLVCTLVCK